MFTGIIEQMAQIVAIETQGSNRTFTLQASLASELKVDQSVAHNGACLTVTQVSPEKQQYTVTAIDETLQKTNLGDWQEGRFVNIERCMQMNGRLDGHIVQGHVDQVGRCMAIADEDGSWRFTFSYEADTGNMTVEKGSICVNGVSLTVVDSQQGQFSVAIIPYTYEHTTFRYLAVGDRVNLEFDILGKYVRQYLQAMQVK
ncbi:riboflavin synthase [Eisenibacter elegans]|uniref:riboflavin synthase n=1 Tax=Eisenibacter elegans TaxID=997 RepID=UPI00041210B6|nr:riboflavin synthase [Eisenibacter elegans]